MYNINMVPVYRAAINQYKKELKAYQTALEDVPEDYTIGPKGLLIRIQ